MSELISPTYWFGFGIVAGMTISIIAIWLADKEKNKTTSLKQYIKNSLTMIPIKSSAKAQKVSRKILRRYKEASNKEREEAFKYLLGHNIGQKIGKEIKKKRENPILSVWKGAVTDKKVIEMAENPPNVYPWNENHETENKNKN